MAAGFGRQYDHAGLLDDLTTELPFNKVPAKSGQLVERAPSTTLPSCCDVAQLRVLLATSVF